MDEQAAVRLLRSVERKLASDLAGIAAEGIADGINPHGCFVYLLWENKDDPVPVYVGKSTNLLTRLGNHMGDRAKQHRVRWITVIRCPTELQMEKTEARLIRHYRPALNVAGIPRA